LTPEELTNWIDRVYATKEKELDCQQTQSLLPAYVEAEFNGDHFDGADNVELHLYQCPDCKETYQALYHLVSLEAKGELQSVADEIEDELSMPQTESTSSELTPIASP
jgi:predicted anti-sigma-YlaC factor YlaD